MAEYQPGAVKQNPEIGAVAVKMAPTVTVGEWFVIDPASGGYYAATSEVEDWADMALVAV